MNKEKRNDLIHQYAKGFEAVEKALQGLTPEMLTTTVFEGKWSAAEIVHHLADSEMTSALRLRKLMTEEFPVIYGYDQDA